MPLSIGVQAPVFSLDTVQGVKVNLADYRGKSNVLVWFSRGFTCPFCRAYMTQLQKAYPEFRAQTTEILQISPNLVGKAREYFKTSQLVFPFLCDPDKRLYKVYQLIDQGPLVASRNVVTSFGHSALTGQFMETSRASATDMLNSAFFQRLQHHALTAVEQGLFLIDKQGVVRWIKTLGPLENLPDNRTLLDTIIRIGSPANLENKPNAALLNPA